MRSPRVLFILPYLRLDSEGWMQYMLQGMAQNLVAICAIDSQRETVWGARTPVVEIGAGEILTRVQSGIRRRIGLIESEQKSQARFNTTLRSNLRKAIQKYSPDIILSHYGDFTLVYKEVFDAFNIPVFLHFHGYDATVNFCDYLQPDVPYFAENYPQDIRNFSARYFLIANSSFTSDRLVEDFGVASNRIIMNYLGVPQTAGNVHFDQPCDPSQSTLQILHLGRLVDFKSPDRTIEAFNLACDRGLQANLVIAGDGPMRSMCELLRRRSPYRDRIRLMGAVNASIAKQLLQESHIFTQHNVTGEISNQQECLGISLLEAMAIGLPVVSTNSGAIRETVISGETGILVEPGDVIGQANAFLQLAASAPLRQRMGQQASRRVRERFEVNQQCARLQLLMQNARHSAQSTNALTYV